MDGKTIMKAVTLVMAVIILILVSALIVGTLLGQTVFSNLTLINRLGLEYNSDCS